MKIILGSDHAGLGLKQMLATLRNVTTGLLLGVYISYILISHCPFIEKDMTR